MPRHGQDSYPPTSRFHSVIGEAELRAAINTSNDDPIPRALALALQLPAGGHPEFESDMARLHREIDLIARLIDRDREVVELRVEIGGSHGPFPMDAVRNLSEALRHQFHFSPAVTSEFLIAFDPAVLGPDETAGLAAGGFNRIGFAAARFDQAILRAARGNGFRSIGMVAVGMQEAFVCANTLRPDRLTVQENAAETLVKAQRRGFPCDWLRRAGYIYIGRGQFALANDDLAVAREEGRLQCGPFGIMAHADCDSIGFGAGAVSQVGGCYSQNAEGLEAWRRELDAGRLPARRGLVLTEDDELRGELIQQLHCRRQIDIRELERGYGIDFRSYFAADLARLAPGLKLGLVQDFGNRIAVCSRGWPWLRSIALCFDAYASDAAKPPEAKPGH